MYKLNNSTFFADLGEPCSVNIPTQNKSIPFDPANTDYQQFVRDIKNGVQLNDANGNAITGVELTTFISTLP